MRSAIDAINPQTRLGIYEFEGHHTHRAYSVVSKTREFDDFTAGNGATRFLPRSHTIHTELCPDGEPSVASMPAGSVLIYDGSLWHGGGASIAKGAQRRCINNIFTRQWLRQQDNIYLSMSKEAVTKLPKLMQRLLGYWIYGYTLGVVDGRPPMEVLIEEQGQ